MNTDKRRYPRRRTLKSGKVIFNNRHSTMDCTVRNMSEGGALLLFPRTPHLPEQFELKLQDGAAFPCRRAWQQDIAVGVEFLNRSPTGTVVEVRIDDDVVFALAPEGPPTLPRTPEERAAVAKVLADALALVQKG